MRIGCVIVNYNTSSQVLELSETLSHYEIVKKIVIIDNNSSEADKVLLLQTNNPKIVILEQDSNVGYGKGNNLGIKYLNSININYALICNPDTFISNSSICNCLKQFDKDDAAICVAPIAIDINKVPYESSWGIPSISQYTFSLCFFLGKKYRIPKNKINYDKNIRVECISGALLLVDVSKFLSLGGFDENIFLYCEETSLGIDSKKAGFSMYIICDNFYSHNHVYSNSSLKQELKQLKMTLKSRRYVLRKKMHASFFWMLIFHTMKFFIYLETILIHFLKMIRRIIKNK